MQKVNHSELLLWLFSSQNSIHNVHWLIFFNLLIVSDYIPIIIVKVTFMAYLTDLFIFT